MRLISNWLTGSRSFSYGVILYNRFGNDDELKKLFEKGKTDFAEKKLLQVLQSLVNEKTNDAMSYTPQGSGVMPEARDPVLIALRNQWMPHFTQMNYLRHEIDKYLDRNSESSMAKRGELARDILLLEKKCMAVWAKRDYYERTGKLPAEYKTNEPVVDPFTAGKRLTTLQSYVRRYKRLVANNPGNEIHASNLKKYEEELKTLKTRH